MSRYIADYLGMTIETASRTMTQLENDAAIGPSPTRSDRCDGTEGEPEVEIRR